VHPWIGLPLALVSALMVNWAYAREHAAASRLPLLKASQPIRAVKLLLGSRPWVIAFGTETAGWIVYVVALRLAPIALVQAVSASGIAVLALASAGSMSRLSRREQVAVAAALVGLVLLALSLVGTPPSDHKPDPWEAMLWLSACAGAAVLMIVVKTPVARAAALGAATGLLFACGDISAKLVGYAGPWLLAIVPLLVTYATGSGVLQSAFQHGNALAAAGMATLLTNAVPIAAGFVLFDEVLPSGYRAWLQVAAFAAIVVSAAALGRQEPAATEPTRGAELPPPREPAWASGEHDDDGGVLEGDGEHHEGVEELVEAEHGRRRIGSAERVDERAERVQDAAREHE
jgi:hypothetical protein